MILRLCEVDGILAKRWRDRKTEEKRQNANEYNDKQPKN